jgi:acyl dehydratase
VAAVKLNDIDELRSLVGTEVGVSDWRAVEQGDVARFADVTGDRQWIHIDAVRAAQSPLGATVAHGLLTLSLGPAMTYELLDWEALGFSLNYGYDRVRFPAPLPTGSRVRMRLSVKSVESSPAGQRIRVIQTFEAEHVDKPVCVAESVALIVGG